MKDRWMLFNKNGGLECWIAFPTKERADNYRLVGQRVWLTSPYCEDGAMTAYGKKFALAQVKSAIRMRDEVVAARIKLTKVTQ